jgi:hypothetical protein
MPDQVTSQHGGEIGVARCGCPFVIDVEALDLKNNRWGGGAC